MTASTRCQTAFRPFVALSCVLALVACNGGGGGASPAATGPGNNNNNNNGGGTPPPPPAFARLWVPNFNAGELQAWNRSSLQADRDGNPDVVLTLPGGTRPNAVTFDAAGNLWVTDNANDRLLAFGRNQLAASGSPTPLVVIDSDGTSIQDPIGLRFDGAGNLWVAAADRLEMFVPTNLDQSGPTTPDRTLRAVGFDYPAGVVFDANGNLWLTNASFTAANNSLAVFTPGQQAAGGELVPQLQVTSSAFALVEGLQFDGAGDLWVASNDGLAVARFAAADLGVPALAETRNLAPVASLEADIDDTASGRTVRKPGGLAFDRDGNLWVNSQRGALGSLISGVLRFSPAQLVFLGPSAVPASLLLSRATSNPGFGGLAFELP